MPPASALMPPAPWHQCPHLDRPALWQHLDRQRSAWRDLVASDSP
ncbi:hypothetical protein [Rhodoferax fermentans]|nr:hypothetical protein [Rhodoferax fermentans]